MANSRQRRAQKRAQQRDSKERLWYIAEHPLLASGVGAMLITGIVFGTGGALILAAIFYAGAWLLLMAVFARADLFRVNPKTAWIVSGLSAVCVIPLWLLVRPDPPQSATEQANQTQAPPPSAQMQQESTTESYFASRYAPITNTPDTTISFISTPGPGTGGRWLKFKARIGHSINDGTRLVIDLPKGIEFEVALYATEHRDQILERVLADIRATHPDLLDIPLNNYMILQHRNSLGEEFSPQLVSYAARGKAEFLVETGP